MGDGNAGAGGGDGQEERLRYAKKRREDEKRMAEAQAATSKLINEHLSPDAKAKRDREQAQKEQKMDSFRDAITTGIQNLTNNSGSDGAQMLAHANAC